MSTVPQLDTRPVTLADPFDDSLIIAGNRLNALQKVKLAQDHLKETRQRAHKNIEAAEIALNNARRDAADIGAYDIIPIAARPVVSAGGAS